MRKPAGRAGRRGGLLCHRRLAFFAVVLRKSRDDEAGMNARLAVKIETVNAKAVKVHDEVVAMREESKRNVAEHKTFTTRIDGHDLRTLGLVVNAAHSEMTAAARRRWEVVPSCH